MVYVRRQTRPKPLKSALKSFGAPIAGWISNRSLAYPVGDGPQGAAVLDDFFPTSSTVRLRRGKAIYASLPSDPAALFSYKNGIVQRLFASTSTTIYDITGTVTPVLTGKTGGDWVVIQFGTTGGVFLVGVNGADTGFLYNGSTFSTLAVTFSDGTNTFTTADMSYVWAYKNRIWFAQKDTMNAWYLPAASIAGAATYFPMAGIFNKGGSLLFGQSWSLDNGAEGGLSEQVVFCSTQGEVAIYQGSDPSVAASFEKVGVYRIGTPLGKNAFFRGGGDIAIATSVGLVPLSKAITLDVTSLNVATISYNIADSWSEAVQQRGLDGWCCELWPELKMAIVSPPDIVGSTQSVVFVANSETGAWCRFRNWRALCTEVFQGQLYFGSPGGFIYAANKTGLDDGVPYSGAVMMLFEDLNSPGSLKVGKMGRTFLRSLGPVTELTTMHVEYDLNLGSTPDASGGSSSNLWGTGVWGSAVWGSTVPDQVSQNWQSISGSGYAVSLACQITSGSIAPLDSEMISMQMTYTEASVVT